MPPEGRIRFWELATCGEPLASTATDARLVGHQLLLGLALLGLAALLVLARASLDFLERVVASERLPLVRQA